MQEDVLGLTAHICIDIFLLIQTICSFALITQRTDVDMNNDIVLTKEWEKQIKFELLWYEDCTT